MKFDLKQYQTKSGEILLYCGAPDFEKLEVLVLESGDIWHSSFEQGYKNAFQNWYIKRQFFSGI
jgi:hypothetical protein